MFCVLIGFDLSLILIVALVRVSIGYCLETYFQKIISKNIF